MTITRRHMGITVLVALALHAGIAIWLTLPTPARFPEPPVQPLRISLLAAVAETTTAAPSVAPPPQPVSKPPLTPPPEPKIMPESVPEPVVQEVPLIPQPVVKPTPEPQFPEPRPVSNIPEFAPVPEPVQEVVQPPLVELSTAPLDAVATAQYEKLLVAWLEKHKKYPRRAKRLRIEGEGMLRILIDRTGRTRQVTLEQRTGNRLLDKAALEMAQRADPFPPMPENDPRRELEFIVPVAFVLR